MTKFYVYNSSKGNIFIEADSIQNFASTEFNPNVMIYSGIGIEAKNLDEATQIYNNPGCGFGEYILENEPIQTAIRKELFNTTIELKEVAEQVKNKLDLLRFTLMLKSVAIKIHEANVLMSQVSNELYDKYDRPKNLSPEIIFETLVNKIIRSNIKYDGKSKKTG